MAESLIIDQEADKAAQYQQLLPQIEALISYEEDLIANLSNIAGALKQAMDFFWVGFYIVKGEQLVLGPYQGPIACTRIAKGRGVCGTAWAEGKTQLVADVEQFPGHIACSSDSKSEIVVPLIVAGTVKMILDVDSNHLNDFDATDQKYLEKLMDILAKQL
ncbi:GAF domain-containing protein [Persicobacter sp. CCB-QB2]|uniref:GAF domain-containing protein n=1 Tax=Persicobacter sp. CCB-QB2 TaxID=1561025 RepID=UPI0006A971AA|nr:GAF domain-containing protein [Persicobacter sp. CCB-QB2]